MNARGESGVALILVLLLTTFLSATALGLALILFMEQLASFNHRSAAALLYVAEAGIELAARDLARSATWDAILAGAEQGGFTDGPPSGSRSVPGRASFNLTTETNRLNCARSSTCTPAQLTTNTRERPWGPNNPRWRPYLYGFASNLPAVVRPAAAYLAVWIADDSLETDGDPSADADEGEPGWRVVRARSAAYGPRGALRAVEAVLTAVCPPDAGEPVCLPGIRVQSWQEVR